MRIPRKVPMALLAATLAMALTAPSPTAQTPTPTPTPPVPSVRLLEQLYPGQLPVILAATPTPGPEIVTTATLRIRRPPPSATPSTSGTLRAGDRASTPTVRLLPFPVQLLETPAPTTHTLTTPTSGPAIVPSVRLAPDDRATSSTLPTRPAERIRINVATADQIMEKLKIDARRARLIVEFRTLYGPFRRPEDLNQVSGINDLMVRQWESAGLLDFN
jgi:hypothetical protein